MASGGYRQPLTILKRIVLLYEWLAFHRNFPIQLNCPIYLRLLSFIDQQCSEQHELAGRNIELTRVFKIKCPSLRLQDVCNTFFQLLATFLGERLCNVAADRHCRNRRRVSGNERTPQLKEQPRCMASCMLN